MNLSDEIEKCKECVNQKLDGSDRLNTRRKPYFHFDVERKWKPDKVRVLFVAESPPWDGKQRYFYNPDVVEKRTNLRKEVLTYLDLNSLKEFRDEGFFLVDSIKCRLDKTKKKRVPARIIRTCSEQFLHREIRELKSRKIFVLGDTAKKALQTFPDFQKLREHKVTEGYDKNLSGYYVILSVFPGGQTRQYKNEIERAFAKIQCAL